VVVLLICNQDGFGHRLLYWMIDDNNTYLMLMKYRIQRFLLLNSAESDEYSNQQQHKDESTSKSLIRLLLFFLIHWLFFYH